ncbi:MAG: hypothetical protein GXP62_03105, partial [Oligoflexia bacterium]|nr:hypothetical protein [Oligoflexia bacterium]
MLPVLTLLACGQFADPMVRALSPIENARHIVWGFTSPDLQTFTRSPVPVAWGLNSLGLAVDDDGALLLTGLQTVAEPTLVEHYLTGPVVRGLRFDGQTWTPRHWEVDDPDAVSYIDPQIFEGQFWYVAPSGKTGDPAHRSEPNPVRSSPPAQTRFSGSFVVDPAPVRVDGALHLFLTQAGSVIHLAGEPLAVRHRLPGVTVPYALQVDGQLLLVAQAVVQGRRQPVIATVSQDALESRPGVLALNWRPVVQLGPLSSCTSPVLGPSPAGGWLLLCVEETSDSSARPRPTP